MQSFIYIFYILYAVFLFSQATARNVRERKKANGQLISRKCAHLFSPQEVGMGNVMLRKREIGHWVGKLTCIMHNTGFEPWNWSPRFLAALPATKHSCVDLQLMFEELLLKQRYPMTWLFMYFRLFKDRKFWPITF